MALTPTLEALYRILGSPGLSAYYLTEDPYVDPDGRWRLRVEGDRVLLERSLAAGWAAFEPWLTLDRPHNLLGLGQDLDLGGNRLRFGDVELYRAAADLLRTPDALTVDDVLTASGGMQVPGATSLVQSVEDSWWRLLGGASAASPAFIIYGRDHAQSGAFGFDTPNAAKDDVLARLYIRGGANIVDLDILNANLDLNGNNILKVNYLQDSSPAPAGVGFLRVGHGVYALVGLNNAGASNRQLLSWGMAGLDVLSLAGDGDLTRFGGPVDLGGNNLQDVGLLYLDEIYGQANSSYWNTRNADGAVVVMRARQTGVGMVPVAGLTGGPTPYFDLAQARLTGPFEANSQEIRSARLGTDINPNGYGGFKSGFCFAQDNVAAGQTAVALKVPGTANGVDITMPFSGSIIGLSVASSENRTAGTATIEPTVAGALTGLQVYLNAGSPNFGRTTAAKDVYPFSAGQNLGAKLTTSADWAPATADILVTIIIEH